MKVYEIRSPGTTDALVLAEREAPVPGPGQVVVAVRAASINFRDHMILQGHYGRMNLPVIPLSDGAGTVVETGEGVVRVRVGDRVAGIFNQNWIAGPAPQAASALGGDRDGMLAERVLLPEEGVVRLPDTLTFEEAAALPCAAVTAWNALFNQERLRPGQTVLVQGTGGVSIFALQFAKMAGARVIVTSSSDEKLERAKSLGASGTINYRTHPEWAQEVLSLTDGNGVDHVVEVGGAGTLARSLQAVGHGGHIAMIGVLSGGLTEVPIFSLLSKQVRLQGVYVGSRLHFTEMLEAIERNGIRPVIDRVFPFAEAREAYRTLASGRFFGKICVRL